MNAKMSLGQEVEYLTAFFASALIKFPHKNEG